MKKNTRRKAATVAVATLLLFSFHPEVRILGFFVQAIGVDVLVLVLAAHIAVTPNMAYHQYILPLLLRTNSLFERIDPFYFAPDRKLIHECPAVAAYSVPLLIPLCFLVLGHLLVYA